MEDCIFCKIINGDFNTNFVYETDTTIVFKDINPKAPIHMLVCPKIHVSSLNELEDKNLMADLLQTVKDVTKKIGLKSYRVQINTGKEAGQEVFHLHIHILGK
ncbi:histidine triad nucleotide-binding protein [bacterium]|nr:histidine triad nucleotide-binding protein [bacterium]